MVKIYPMGVFQEQKNLATNMNIEKQIINACGKKPNEESCGFIVYDNGEFRAIESENRAQDKSEEFYIPAKEFLFIKNSNNVIAVYHSHPKTDENPSEFDKNNSNLICLPFVIFSLKNRRMSVFEPEFLDCDKSTFQNLKEQLNIND